LTTAGASAPPPARRWLVVTVDFPPAFTGGIAAWAQDLALALYGAGEAVTVLARGGADTAAADAALPFPVIRMAGRSWGSWQGTWALLQAGPHLGPGVIAVAATWRLATGLAAFTRALGARLVVAFHGSDLSTLRSAPAALRRVVEGADALTPVSAFLREELVRLGLAADHAQVLPMPLALPPARLGSGEGLALVCRLTPLKGVDRARRLAQALGEPLTVVGDGPARALLEGQPGVRLLGARPRVEALRVMAGARAVLLLPETDGQGMGAEGLGLCLIEAAAQGVPVIGCRTGGVPEATGPGLLLEDPDHPDLAAVRRFLDDPAAGLRAHAWAHGAHGASRSTAVLRALVGEPRPRHRGLRPPFAGGRPG
jgi:phosphatidylinositol alpha-1,6-mannosyltransferase